MFGPAPEYGQVTDIEQILTAVIQNMTRLAA